MVETPFLENEFLILNLHRSDFSTASALSRAVDDIFGQGTAVPIDGSSIRVQAPADPTQRVSFVSLLENVEVEPATPPAQVIVNSRTGTIIINGNVRVTPAAITHGSLTVRVTEDPNVQTQTNVVANDAGSCGHAGRACCNPGQRRRMQKRNWPKPLCLIRAFS